LPGELIILGVISLTQLLQIRRINLLESAKSVAAKVKDMIPIILAKFPAEAFTGAL
jgi:hypothetical protein